MGKKKLEVYPGIVKLARCGKERDWKSIQEKLVERGYRRAPDLLDNAEIRAILNLCCEYGRKSQRNLKDSESTRWAARGAAPRSRTRSCLGHQLPADPSRPSAK
jgi:hypothetical protein